MYKIKKIKPMHNYIVVTMNCYDRNYKTGGIIDSSKAGLIKEYQTVVEVGPMVRGIKAGDVVFINPQRYIEIKHHFKDADANNVQQDDMHAILRIPQFVVYDQEDGASRSVMMIGDNDIYFVAEGEEFDECPAIITEEKPKIIVP